MILWLSGKLADALADRGAIARDDRDIYVYGMDILLSTVLNLVCIVGIGALAGMPAETALYLLSFIALRSAAGGYHANTHLSCLVIMLAAFGVSMALLRLLPASSFGWLAVMASAVSLIAVFALAPAPHENRPVSGTELKKFRRLSIWITLAEAGAVLLLALLSASQLALAASFGMLTSAASLGAARIAGANGKRANNDN